MFPVFRLTADAGVFQLKSRCFSGKSIFSFRYNSIIFQYKYWLFR